MTASPFTILHLHPPRYSREYIDRRYRAVRRDILRAGGSDRQRRLDDALIAQAMLRSPAGQVALIKRVRRDVADTRPHAPMPIPPRPRRPISTVHPAADPPEGSGDDAHRRFARMVVEHVEGGILRFTSRSRLVLLAGGLGIVPFKANWIIAEVLHDLQRGRRPAGRDVTAATMADGDTPRRRRYGLRLSLALAAALATDILLMLWLT